MGNKKIENVLRDEVSFIEHLNMKALPHLERLEENIKKREVHNDEDRECLYDIYMINACLSCMIVRWVNSVVGYKELKGEIDNG